MSSIDAISNSYTSYDLQADTLGKEDFLEMLIAQLKYQDPLDPMDGTDFTAQLAQFSSLEQLSNMNSNLEFLVGYQVLTNNLQAVGLIGKEVTAKGNTVQADGVPVDVTYSLPEAVSEGTVSIYTSEGSLVDTIEFANQEAGTNSVTWDCTSVEAGVYTFEVAATNAADEAVTVDLLSTGEVTGVNYRDGYCYILIGDQEIPFENVTLVTNSGSESESE